MLEVKLVDIGEGMHEGEILHYFVKVGDRVTADQALVEVQTDKMTAELPSPGTGIVKEILVETGNTVTVGTTLLIIEEEGGTSALTQTEEKSESTVEKQEPVIAEVTKQESKEFKPAAAGQMKVVLAAPYTRKIARDHGVNIEEIVGTGPAGRVTDEDVYRYIEQLKNPVSTQDEVKKEVSEQPAAVYEVAKRDPEVIPFKGRRKQIAKKMSQSLFTIPHVTHFEEIDMTDLIEFRSELKEMGHNISVAAFFIKALQLALKDFPIFNAKLDEENEVIKLEKVYNIGIAADTEEGLIVPVIHNVETKSIKQIHKEMKELNKKAQENKLSMKELTGSTFTISNVGPLGSIGATPIINYPEVALMAFHKTKEMPVVRNKEIVIRSMMNVSMSFDHRVADGGTAVAFTNRFKELIENPKMLLLELV